MRETDFHLRRNISSEVNYAPLYFNDVKTAVEFAFFFFQVIVIGNKL